MRARAEAVTVWAAALAVALAGGAAWSEVIGKSTTPLDAREARVSECSLGNLAADAARSALGAQVALVQASQLRAQQIPAGEVTREALEGALLYPDESVVLVEISGLKMREALERSLSMLPKPSTSFLQVSGLAVRFRSDAEPGERVVDVKVGGEELSGSKSYRVAMPASLAKGALGYFRIFNGLKPKETGPALADALCDYVRAMRVVSPGTGRLRDLSRPSE